MEKNCKTCGVVMKRKRWKNGKLDSTFKNRKFCSSKCYGKANELKMPSKPTARKRAQRAVAVQTCEICGSNKQLERHHADYNKPLDVQILCNQCHSALHAYGVQSLKLGALPEVCKTVLQNLKPWEMP